MENSAGMKSDRGHEHEGHSHPIVSRRIFARLRPICAIFVAGALLICAVLTWEANVKDLSINAPDLLSRETKPSSVSAYLAEFNAAYNASFGKLPLLPPEGLERGLAYVGTLNGMQGFVSKLMKREAVEVVALGGSTTEGKGAYLGNPYTLRFGRWLNGTFPASGPDAETGHRLSNKGMGATPSSLYNLCSNRLVPETGDLYIVEFAVNDAWDAETEGVERKQFEQLLRRLLKLPGRPAVVILLQFSYFKADKQFFKSAEADMAMLGQYYDLPVLSMRNAVWPLLLGSAPGFSVKGQSLAQLKHDKAKAGTQAYEAQYLYADPSHPADLTGHRLLSDLLVELTRVALEDWGLRRLAGAGAGGGAAAGSPSRDGQEAEPGPTGRGEGLLPPAIRDNREPPEARCYLEEDFAGLIAGGEGFALLALNPEGVNRAAQKWGWQADAAGSWIELDLPTGAAIAGGSASAAGVQGGAKEEPARVALVLAVHRSWKEVGSARLSCRRGCACEDQTLDGLWAAPTSQTGLVEVLVGRAERCVVRLTVRDLADAPGNSTRFILRGAIVSDMLGAPLPTHPERQVEKMQ